MDRDRDRDRDRDGNVTIPMGNCASSIRIMYITTQWHKVERIHAATRYRELQYHRVGIFDEEGDFTSYYGG